MAETATIKAVLTRYGVKKTDGSADPTTLKWITDVVGLNRTSVFGTLSKANMDHIFKRLGKDAESATIADDRKPDNNLNVTKAIEQVTVGVKYYASRGVRPDGALMARLNNDNAVQFFDLVVQHRKKDVDKNEAPELPVLGKGISKNSPKFLEWKDQVIVALDNYTSVDGVGTLAANFRTRVAPLAWNDVDMSWTLDKIRATGSKKDPTDNK